MSEIATTGETVYAGPVKDITEFIQACSFLSLPDTIGSLVLLEKQPQKIVGKEDRQNLLLFMEYACPVSNFSEYTAGRIFHEEFELRWEKINSGTQVVYIGKQQALPPLTEDTNVLKGCVRAISSYYLFGKRLDDRAVKNIGQPAQEGDFAEVRIPRLLRYPVKDKSKDYVKLNVYEYRHKVTNERILFRFRSLAEVKE
jgi:hypothetical protein